MNFERRLHLLCLKEGYLGNNYKMTETNRIKRREKKERKKEGKRLAQER